MPLNSKNHIMMTYEPTGSMTITINMIFHLTKYGHEQLCESRLMFVPQNKNDVLCTFKPISNVISTMSVKIVGTKLLGPIFKYLLLPLDLCLIHVLFVTRCKDMGQQGESSIVGKAFKLLVKDSYNQAM